MNVIDIIIVIPVIWIAWKGFSKGFIMEAASLAALMAGIYCSIHFSGFISGLLDKWFTIESAYVPLIAFALTFILVIILIHLLAKLIDRVVKAAALGLVNRIAGAAFGAAKALLIIAVIILLFNRFDKQNRILKEELKQGSLLYQPLNNMVESIYPSVHEEIDGIMKNENPAQPENIE